MPYVPPHTSIQSPITAPLPLPVTSLRIVNTERIVTEQSGKDNHAHEPVDNNDSVLDQESEPLVEADKPSSNLALSIPIPPISRPSRTVSLDIIDRTPPLPNSMNVLATNFAAVDISGPSSMAVGAAGRRSDTVVPKLKDVLEGETIAVPGARGEAVDMPRFPGGNVAVDVDVEGQSQDGAQGDQLPDLVPSGGARGAQFNHATSTHVEERGDYGSSTSLDTMNDTPSPLSPADDGTQGQLVGDQVVVVQQGEEEDPKVLALHKYKEGLYTYTVSINDHVVTLSSQAVPGT